MPRHATQTNKCPLFYSDLTVIMLAVNTTCTVVRAETKAQCDIDVSSEVG